VNQNIICTWSFESENTNIIHSFITSDFNFNHKLNASHGTSNTSQAKADIGFLLSPADADLAKKDINYKKIYQM